MLEAERTNVAETSVIDLYISSMCYIYHVASSSSLFLPTALTDEETYRRILGLSKVELMRPMQGCFGCGIPKAVKDPFL